MNSKLKLSEGKQKEMGTESEQETHTQREREIGRSSSGGGDLSWQIGLPLGLIPVQACSAPSA